MARKPTTPADPVTAYAQAVAAGQEPAGPHVRGACQRHLDDLKQGPSRGLLWDLKAAQRAIGFFRDVLTVEVRGEAVPFVLLPWQAFIVGSLFGWKRADTGYRRFREAFIETGKGSGKSPLAAGIGLLMLAADGEQSAEVYAAASKREQAAILFRDAVAMWKRSPKLRGLLKPSGAEGAEYQLAYLAKSAFFKVIASKASKVGGGQSGPRPHCGLLDEIHEHENDSAVRLMRAGTKGRRQALLFMITNSGSSRTGVCWDYHEYAVKLCAGLAEINDSFFAYVCAVDDDDDPITDESCWAKANPSLGHTFQHSYLRELVANARGMPSTEAIVRRLNFCQWTDAETPWIDRDLWDSRETDDLDPESMADLPCWLSLDLSTKRDLTAAAACWRHPDQSYSLAAWGWTPRDTMDERGRADSVDYRTWANDPAGHLIAEPGRIIDKGRVAAWLQQFAARNNVQALAFDQAMIDDFQAACDAIGFDVWIDDRKYNDKGEPDGKPGKGLRMIRHGQGHAGYNQQPSTLWMPRSIAEFEETIIKGTIRIRRSPVLRWCSASAVLMADPQNNRKWDKRKSSGRIDLIVAACMAVGAARNAPVHKAAVKSFWEQ